MPVFLDQIKDPRTRQRVADALEAAGDLKRQINKECPKKKRIRQSSKGPNKLEREAFNIVNQWNIDMTIRHHCLTFALANGVKYTPDIVGIRPGRMNCWEIKGPKMWDDAVVKLKVAASMWPDIKWLLMWKDDGQWHEQEILP